MRRSSGLRRRKYSRLSVSTDFASTARKIQSDSVTVTLIIRPPRLRRTISQLSIRPKPRVVSTPPVARLVVIRVPASRSKASLSRVYASPDVSRLVATSRSCAVSCSVRLIARPAFIAAISWLTQ